MFAPSASVEDLTKISFVAFGMRASFVCRLWARYAMLKKMVEIGCRCHHDPRRRGRRSYGFRATTLLLPQVLDAVKVPVVAAGGFFDGRGLAAALAYGAAGVAMGTRFLMTRDCPVPEVTKTRYVRAGLDDIVLTTRLDGLQHRLLRNEILSEVENAGSVPLLVAALKNAWLLKQRTGASVAELISAARGMQRESGLTFGQALMAANSPVLIERSMIQGRPAEGVMSTGQVAGILSDLPTCEELIVRMVTEARQRLNALSGG